MLELLSLDGPRVGTVEEKQPLWEKLPESERGEIFWLLLFFCQYSYFIFLSFILLIHLGPGQVTPANGIGRNQLPSIQSKRKNG